MERHTQYENELVATSETDTDTEQKQESYLVAQSLYSGPLPHPDVLEKYENVYPGSASKIFQMAEEQAQHRRNMESENLRLAARDSSRGAVFGFIIALVGIISGLIVACLNPSKSVNIISGSAISGVSLIAVVRTFVIGSKKTKESKENE